MADQDARSAASTLPLTREEIDRLATYNAEVARGLVHTPGYRAAMECLQRTFNATEGNAWTRIK